ncbi:MAG: hypothetical protein ACM3JD_07915 [Rudaea sp.]
MLWRKDAPGEPAYSAPTVNETPIPIDLTVEQALARGPGAVSVFVRFRMACVGCPMAIFDTLEEAATNYGIAPRMLAAAITDQIRSDGSIN